MAQTPVADESVPSAPSPALGPLEDLIVCPACDALYHAVAPEPGHRTTCKRCHHLLITPRTGAIVRIVALAITVLVLLQGAVFLPFLEIHVAGFRHATSVFEAALTFSGPLLSGLSVAVLMMIVGIPLMRVLLILYVLIPIQTGLPNFPGAHRAFRWSETLRPWSMAEIFVIGVGVALVKVADLANVEFGPAFFMFAGLVAVSVLQDGFMCRWSIWKALDQNGQS